MAAVQELPEPLILLSNDQWLAFLVGIGIESLAEAKAPSDKFG